MFILYVNISCHAYLHKFIPVINHDTYSFHINCNGAPHPILQLTVNHTYKGGMYNSLWSKIINIDNRDKLQRWTTSRIKKLLLVLWKQESR